MARCFSFCVFCGFCVDRRECSNDRCAHHRLQTGTGDGVVRDPGAAARDRVRSEPRQTGAARHAVPRRVRPRGEARRLLRSAAGRDGVRVLRLPDAVHAGHQRPCERARRALARARQGFRDRHGQLRSARHAGDRLGEKGRVYRALQEAGRRGRLALSDRRSGIHRPPHESGRLPLRVGQGDEPVRASERRHRADARRTFLPLSLRGRVRPARSALRARRSLERQRSGRWSIRCCSTAITTTR